MKFTIDDIAPLSLGSAVLGTGGGGDPYIGTLALRNWMSGGYQPRIIAAEELPDDAFVAPIAMIGSPAVALEKLSTKSFATDILERVEHFMNRKIDAVISGEIGGVNSLLPLMCACAGDLPVIDGDGIGRAFPTVDRTTFNLHGVPICPIIMVNEHGECTTVDVKTTQRAETVARMIATQYGANCVSSIYMMSGRQVKESAAHGTMSLAINIGRAIIAARSAGIDPFDALFGALSRHSRPIVGGTIFDGKVVDLERRMIDGYNIGSGTVEGLDAFRGQTASFMFQNEYIMVRRNGQLAAVAPDLIAFLDRDTAQPITCESVRYGQRLRIVGFEADPIWYSDEALKLAGPASFGIDEPFRPIRQLLSEG